MDHSPLLLIAVPIAGFIAGFVNTLAGSGSLLTLPVLILLGLPANIANGTNRVGVLLQNIVAVATFRRGGALHTDGSAKIIVPSLLGSIVGAQLAVDLDETLMRQMIGMLMIVMLAIMLAQPNRWIAEHASGHEGRLWVQVPIFFAIGVYGGFIQAGIGIFLVAGLVLGAGHNLIGANVIKNLIVLIVTAAALVVFIRNDQVRWDLGLLMAAGNGAGAWIAARLALTRGASFVRWAFMIVLVASAAALLAGA